MTYTDLFTGRKTDCGDCEGSCPIELVIQWVLVHGNPAPGDYISVEETGQVLHVSRVRGAA